MSENTTQFTQNVDVPDFTNIAAFKAEDPQAVNRLYGEYLSSMFVYVKSGIIFELNNPTLHQACDRISRVSNFIYQQMEGSASMHFLPDGVYINRTLLKVMGSRFEQGEYMTQIFNSMGVGSLSLSGATDRDDWLDFMRQFHMIVRGEVLNADLSSLKLPNIQLQPPDAKENKEADVAVTDRFRTLRGYSVGVITMRQVVGQLQQAGELRLVMLKRALLELAAVSEACPDILLGIVNLKRHKADLSHHLINTSALIMIMARELGVNRKETLELIMQAALHDVGRSMCVEPVGDFDTVLVERRRAQETVSHVARTLAMFNRTTMRVAVANEVRFWVDGKSPVNQNYQFSITAPSRLVAVAHAYDYLTTPTKNRASLLPDEALQLICSESGKRYDEAAARVLVNVLGVYPIGSVVALSNGQTAIVLEAPRHGDPSKPRVKVIRNADSRQNVDGAMLDLNKSGNIRILNCVDAEETKVNIPAFLLS